MSIISQATICLPPSCSNTIFTISDGVISLSCQLAQGCTFSTVSSYSRGGIGSGIGSGSGIESAIESGITNLVEQLEPVRDPILLFLISCLLLCLVFETVRFAARNSRTIFVVLLAALAKDLVVLLSDALLRFVGWRAGGVAG